MLLQVPNDNYDKSPYKVSSYPKSPQENFFARLFTSSRAELICHLSLNTPKNTNLTHKHTKRPYNQDIKVRVTTKDI